jgi:hypothetical protein
LGDHFPNVLPQLQLVLYKLLILLCEHLHAQRQLPTPQTFPDTRGLDYTTRLLENRLLDARHEELPVEPTELHNLLKTHKQNTTWKTYYNHNNLPEYTKGKFTYLQIII